MDRQSPETELVERARAGSIEAFTELVRAHQAAVRAYAARYVRGRDAIDDLAQEIFLAAHRGLGAYRGEAPFRLWLLGIGRRRVSLHMRDEARWRAHETPGLDAAVARWQAELVDSDEERLAELDREMTALAACLQKLPPDNAEVIRAHYFRAQSLVSIAQRLGKKESAVRMALLRIRQALRACVEQRLHSGEA
jgi:RNA polymerase sigma-70 factor (ECF subfamily)